jgi:N12 class adenine-specific DNA methylase
MTDVPSPTSSVEDFRKRVDAGVEGISPSWQTAARSGGRSGARAAKAINSTLAAQQDTEAKLRDQQAADQQRQAAKDQAIQIKADEAQQRHDQAVEARKATASGAETEINIENGRSQAKLDANGQPVFKPGPVGDPRVGVAADVAQRSSGILGGDGAIGASGGTAQPAIVQDFRNSTGAMVTEPVKPKTDAKTGEQTVTMKDSFGREVSQAVGVDPKIAKLEDIAKRKSMVDLQRQQLDLAESQIGPSFHDAASKADTAAKKLAALTDKPKFIRNDAGQWVHITDEGKTTYPDPMAVAAWQAEVKSVQQEAERHSAAKAKVAPQWDNLQAQKAKIAKAKVDLAQEEVATKWGISPDDSTLSSAIAKDDAIETGIHEPTDFQSAADPSVPPVPTADPTHAVVQGAAEATNTGAKLADAVAATSIEATPEGAKAFADKALAGLKDADKITVDKLNVNSGSMFNLSIRGRPVGALVVDPDSAYLQLAGGGDSPQDVANIGARAGIPVYLGAPTPTRKSPTEAAAWSKEILAIATAPKGATVGANGEILDALPENPFDTPASRLDQIKRLGGDFQSIAKAAGRDIPIQVAESLAQTLYGTSLQASNPQDPKLFQKWLWDTHASEKAAAEKSGESSTYDSVLGQWSAAQPGKLSADADTRNQIKRRFLGEQYAANRGKPGVNRRYYQNLMAEGAPGPNTIGGKVWEFASDKTGKAVSLGIDAVGSTIGMPLGVANQNLQKLRGFLGNDEAAHYADEYARLRGRSWENFKQGIARNSKAFVTPEGIAVRGKFDQAISALGTVIDSEIDSGQPNTATIEAAKDSLIKSTMALHNLAPDESWPITEEILRKDPAVAYSLNHYIQTADPTDLGALRERLMMSNGQRQLTAELDQRLAGLNKLEASIVGGSYAGWQEVAVEAAADAATLVSFGGSKVVQASLKGVGAATKAAKIAKMTERIAAGLEKFEQIGLKSGTLEKPLSTLDKARNFGVATFKGSIDEGIENVTTDVANNDPNLGQSFVEGVIGTPFLIPAFHVMGSISQGLAGRIEANKLNAANSKFASNYNATFADLPGFKAITPEQAGAARALINTPEFETAHSEYQQAIADFKTAAGTASQAAPSDRTAVQVKLDRVTGQLSKVRQSMQAEGISEDRQTALAAQEKSLAEIEQTLTDQLDAPDTLDAMMQARQKLSEVHARLAEMTVDATDAVQEIADLENPKQRTFFSGIAKVATGNEGSLTQNERSAIGGATTRDGAAFFATVAGDKHGETRTLLTDEARAELRSTMPALGKLVKTTESEALFESQVAAAAPAEQQQAPAAPVRGIPATAPEVSIDTPATPAEATPAKAETHSPAKAPAAPKANAEKPETNQRRVFEVTNTPGNRAKITDPATGETVWEGKQADAEQARADLQDATDSPLAVANRAHARLKSAFPGMKAKLEVEDAPSRNSGGAVALPGKIAVNLEDLTKNLEGYTPERRDARMDAILDEEFIHVLQYEAVAKLAPEGADPNKFIEDYYGNLWSEFTPAQQKAAAEIYQHDFSKKPEWHRAAETVRMLVQQRQQGRVTELTKAFDKNMPARLIELLGAAIEYLKTQLVGGKLSPRVQAHIDTIESMLADAKSVAGKRSKAEAASVESGTQGTDAIIPAGKEVSIVTPNNEQTIKATATAVNLDQLVGSEDPRFPGKALQPRDRKGQASAAQREEMVKNLRENPEQYRRYLEGSTTDTGRLLVAPLFENGQHATTEDGRPLFYVLSGNGRRNAISEASRRGQAGGFFSSIANALKKEGLETDGIKQPVPVAVFQPKDGAEAIRIAELSNRDAQLAVNNTEQATRDARSIESGNLLNLWAPDEAGNIGAASNRDFVKAFAKATGDEGILSKSGDVTEEGILRIERAMIASLLGPKESVLLEQLFNRSDALGLRNIIGGIATEAGSLLKLAIDKPEFDLTPVLSKALDAAVEAKSAVAAGTAKTVDDYFSQGDLFGDNTATPESQLAQAIASTRSKKAVREILSAYRTAADKVDTTTGDMFGESTSRADLIAKALEARPIDQVVGELEVEFGPTADLPTKLKLAIPAIRKLDPAMRRDFTAAVNAEADRLRAGVFSAEEWQRLNPDALQPRQAMLQRFIDSHTPESIQSGFNRLTSPQVQEAIALASSFVPTISTDFVDFPADFGSLGIPRARMPQVKMADRDEFIKFLKDKGVTVTNELVDPTTLKPSQREFSPSKSEIAKGVPEDRRLFISKDNYVLDGHHQWVGQMGFDKIKASRIDLPVQEALDATFEFPKTYTAEGIALASSSTSPITTANINDFAGAVDIAPLKAETDNLTGAFDLSKPHTLVPLSSLVSDKNELEDPKFKAGLKKDPRQTAADWMVKAIKGEDNAKKRAPLDVYPIGGGQYGITDGNATAQAMMLAGWSQAPVNISTAPTLSSSAPTHAAEGNYRSDWKITRKGRNLIDANGSKFVTQSVDLGNGKTTIARADGSTFEMPLKQAEKTFMVELDEEELALEPIFAARKKRFAAAKPAFDAKIAEIAAGLPEGIPLIPDLKGMPRSLEKAAQKVRESKLFHEQHGVEFDEQAERTKIIDEMADILRASIIVDDMTQVMGANAAILRAFVPDSKLEDTTKDGDVYRNTHVSLVIADRFKTPTPAGYSDVQIKVEIAPGMFAELQVHIPEMLIAKEGWFPGIPERYKAEILGVPNGVGHKLFEEYRTYPKDSVAPRKLELGRQMGELYALAIRAANARFASKNSSQVNGPRVSAPSGNGALSGPPSLNLPLGPNPNTPSPSTATGTPSSSQNSAAGEKGFTGELTNKPSNPPGEIQGNSGPYLKSSPSFDLFGNIDAQIAGPRAKAKANAIAAAKSQPSNSPARANIAKRIAKNEGLADLDLFASAAQKSLDAKPKKSQRGANANDDGQLGFTFGTGLHGGQSTEGSRGPRAERPDQGVSGTSGSQDSVDGGSNGGATEQGLSGPDRQPGGSGAGSPDAGSDIGGGRPGGSGSTGSAEGGAANPGDAGRRKLIERNRPTLGSPERNFTIGRNTVLAEGGSVTRMRNNVAAIDLLRTLEKEGRNATPEEKTTLAKFVGWGGLPQVFDEEKALQVERGDIATRRDTADRYERNYPERYLAEIKSQREQADKLEAWDKKWGDSYRQLKSQLSPEEWEAARESTINAHYTSPLVIGSMWDAVKRFGFDGGNVLEPAGGVGHYFGLMPPSLVGRSNLFGIELDSISGRIFSKLYPEADIEVTGFERNTLPENSQDLVISNVPFANFPVTDDYLSSQSDAPSFMLHNYFFEKALRMARPGGIVAFISTAHTMDSGIAQRKWIAERADFLGAIRLPNTAFKGNANTDVVTDIIYLRKPDGSPAPLAGESWTSVAPVKLANGEEVQINEYFARHPEMIMGGLANDGSMYAGKKEMTVHPTGDLGDMLRAALEKLPQNVTGNTEATDIERLSKENRDAKPGAFIEENGQLQIKGSTDVIAQRDRAKVRAFMKLRDALNNLYALEGSPTATDAEIAAQRGVLNRAYDSFVGTHKNLHTTKTKKLLESDPDFYRTLGLEVPTGKRFGLIPEYKKADVFTKRILEPRVAPTKADNIDDAILHSFRWKGRLDAAYVGKLMGLPLEAAESKLLESPSVFRDPTNGLIEHGTNYLSGNVRRKLRDAELAAKTDPTMQRNVDALRAALPADVGWADISFKMGSAWIPAATYQRFLFEKVLGYRNGGEVIYHKGVGEIIGDSFVVSKSSRGYPGSVDVQWGTPRRTALEIAESVLNQRDPRVNDTVDGKPVYNPQQTDLARQAATRMAEAFTEWTAANPDVQTELHRIYNESFNSHVIPKYDGSFMQLPWVAKDFDLYPEKKHVVWRGLQEGSMLVAHGVGGGKTIIGTALAMEAKRLGLAKKPLIVVHNATLEQFATTIGKMAPTARVLVARKEDLAGPKRKEFMGRVRAGDWDAVIMAHSTFDLIPDDPEWERQQLNDLISELEDAIREQDPNANMDAEIRDIKDPSVKELVKMRKRLKDRMSALQARRTDDVLMFQELGIDTMIVDEAHRYKKQPFVTRQSNIAGIDTSFSKRGSAMQLRSKWIQATNRGRGVYTMTGTPVTNTLGESWNMVRLVRPDLLKEFGVQTFDRFVSVFGNIKQSGELRPNGKYKPVTRLSEFTNIPEWNRFWGLAADVKMGDDMDVKGRPKIKGGKPALTVVPRTAQVKAIMDEISKVIDRYDAMTGKEKHENQHIPLLTYNAARMAAIDVRLINPEAKDEPGSKVNVAIGNVMRLYKQTASDKGSQVIFADSYRPLRTTKLDLSAAEFERQNDGDDAEPESGFNLYHDIREKLVKQGVPREEIAIIGEAKNDKQREAMFAAVNSGKIRIIMGSTETLGTGVNMQERMIAAHHLDVPWTPAGLEQRDGRVYRQGNLWAEKNVEIEIMRYGMKDTLDAALWQKLETKERMIKQAVSGKVNARTIEDDAGLLNYMEQKAALSGADGMLKFKLDEEVRQSKNEWRAYRNRQFDIQRAVGEANRWINHADQELPEASRVAKAVAPLVDVETPNVEWTISGGDPLKGEDARKAIDAAFKERRKKAGQIMAPDQSESIKAPLHLTANGVPVIFTPSSITEDIANAANPDLRWNISWRTSFETAPDMAYSRQSPHPGSAMSETLTAAKNLSLAPKQLENQKAQSEADLATYADEQSKPFDKAESFRRALINQAALYHKMGILLQESDEVYTAGIGEDWRTVIAQEIAKQAAPGERIETPANYPGKGLAPALASSPTLADITTQALAAMPPIYRQVFAEVVKTSNADPAVIAAKFGMSEKAVMNITNQVRARVRALTEAASPSGLSPAMIGDQFNGGRPDLALSTNPSVAAIDQIRNQEQIPDVRSHDTVNAEASAMLAKDYDGTYNSLLAKARDLAPFSDTEVAAAKMLIARETIAGAGKTAEERMKLALLIHGYRDVGTETARSLAMRRDPHQSPAERHAQYIAEALYTPDPATRERLRKAPRQSHESILAGWLARVDGIRQELKAQGVDIDASLAAFNQKKEATAQAEAASPEVAKTVADEIRKLGPVERNVVNAIRSGSNYARAAIVSGIDTNTAKAIYAKFYNSLMDSMRKNALQFVNRSLGLAASAAPSSSEAAIASELGFAAPDDIDESDLVPAVNKKRNKPTKRRPSSKPQLVNPTPEAQARLDAEWEKWQQSGTSSWKAYAQEMKLEPMLETTGDWNDSRPFTGQGELLREPINETTGTFDLNDPKAVKAVMDAFALARGTKLDALMEFWRMSILSGPQTHIVNAASNMINSAYNLLPRRAAEATVNSVLGMVGQGDVKSAGFGEFAEMARTLHKAVQGAARTALRSWQLESHVFEAYATAAAQQLDFTGVGGEYRPPALGGKFGKLMRSISFRAMTAADEFQKRLYGELEAAAQAHRIAKQEEKLSGPAYTARVEELMQPGSVAWVRALDEAKRITFQQDIDGTNPRAIARLDQLAELAKKGREMPYLGRPLTLFLPFIDTPLNVFKQALEMSPLGGMLAVVDGARALRRKIFRGELSQAEADAAAAELYDRTRLIRDITNQSLGIMLYFALKGLTQPPDDDDEGLPMITGTQPYKSTKAGERAVAMRTMPPQSIRIGNTMFSYSRVEPFATVLAGTVDAIVTLNRTGLTAESASLYAATFKDQVNDKTFLKGVSDLINAWEDPGRFAENLTGNIVTGFIPNLIRQPIREMDSTARDTSPRSSDGFFATIAKKVGYSVVPQAAPVKMDVWGNPVPSHRGKPLGGFALTDTLLRIVEPSNLTVGATVDPIDRYIFNYNLQTADPKERLSIMPIDDYVMIDKKKVAITPEQQSEANRRAGKAARAALPTTWDWKTPTAEGIERIKDAVEAAQRGERDRLRAEARNPIPPSR